MPENQIKAALDHLEEGAFQMGPEWASAHEICQQFEGQEAFDWIHAVVHRIEGDDGNARYWYNRCGHPRHAGSIQEEVANLRAELLKG
ncbi:hypothetical protein ACMU_16035 [Actibacterium mucosum KCTC 23349]|uniref:Uncharacterized protein n=1 Tax=Actibacterium mucosum KCTC 23349 TaxID=1454373 RepID=A0A037ZEQ9_9RHOB|nr:hypothetical protein [Actibacterium mucosum]KAJ54627.1 hypothetical protein ACMU_16035 [Actibacterium mucosum KCTC 23349]